MIIQDTEVVSEAMKPGIERPKAQVGSKDPKIGLPTQ